MNHLPQYAYLKHLTEYPLGSARAERRRDIPFTIEASEEELYDWEFSSFAWWNTRCLETRQNVPSNEGVWPINHSRCDRKFGDPGIRFFPRFSEHPPAECITSDVWKAASRFRLLCYWRIPDSESAIRHLSAMPSVRYAGEVTTEWYDPPGGKIHIASEAPEIYGSHAVPIFKFDGHEGRFHFRNSWGLWGDCGYGSFDREHFDRFVVEAWDVDFRGFFVPREIHSGLVCLEWKWEINHEIGVHGCEIVDGASDDRLAWAFCVRRGKHLDIDEFFVWPSERGKGYGRALATMVRALGARMKLPLRALVSFADTEPENLPAIEATSRLLDIDFSESNERWVHLVGVSKVANRSQTSLNFARRRPTRPAFLVEWLRPKDEVSIAEPTQYTVFFGTNREQEPSSDGTVRFSGRRGGDLTLGTACVEIPMTHRFGSTGRLWVKVWRQLVEKRPAITETRVIASEDEFCSIVAKVLVEYPTSKPHNLLFIHGYRVSFDEAVKQAATLGTDLKTPGATFLFSWPSASRLKSYTADEAAIEASLPYLDEFVRVILERSSKKHPLNIIAHSMGNRALLRYLDGLASSMPATDGRIDQIIFAAPDVDSDVFTESVKRTAYLATRATLYVTRGDLAVQASEWLHGFPRAGLAPPVTTADTIDTIMVEGFNLLDLGHGYFASAGPVLHDIFQLLHFGSDPAARAGVCKAATNMGQPYWKIRLP